MAPVSPGVRGGPQHADESRRRPHQHRGSATARLRSRAPEVEHRDPRRPPCRVGRRATRRRSRARASRPPKEVDVADPSLLVAEQRPVARVSEAELLDELEQRALAIRLRRHVFRPELCQQLAGQRRARSSALSDAASHKASCPSVRPRRPSASFSTLAISTACSPRPSVVCRSPGSGSPKRSKQVPATVVTGKPAHDRSMARRDSSADRCNRADVTGGRAAPARSPRPRSGSGSARSRGAARPLRWLRTAPGPASNKRGLELRLPRPRVVAKSKDAPLQPDDAPQSSTDVAARRRHAPPTAWSAVKHAVLTVRRARDRTSSASS